MSHSHEEIQKHVKVYISVFVSLLILTFITVGASYFHFGSIKMNIAIALVIATIKGSLVAGYFMHLISEQKIIYFSIALTAIFFVALLFLPIFTFLNPIKL